MPGCGVEPRRAGPGTPGGERGGSAESPLSVRGLGGVRRRSEGRSRQVPALDLSGVTGDPDDTGPAETGLTTGEMQLQGGGAGRHGEESELSEPEPPRDGPETELSDAETELSGAELDLSGAQLSALPRSLLAHRTFSITVSRFKVTT